MSRKFISFPIRDYEKIKLQMLNWVNRFNICAFLDNHHYPSPAHRVECLAAAGSLFELSAPAGNALRQLEVFQQHQQDWLFGHFAYDLKNEIEALKSSNDDPIQFPDLFFFVPQVILQLTAGALSIGVTDDSHDSVYGAINEQPVKVSAELHPQVVIRHRLTKEAYLETIQQLQRHIQTGDCYEINFCQEFFAEQADIDPLLVYRQLNESSPNPFSAYYKTGEQYVLCASPERYLQKKGNSLISQPIKGTRARNREETAPDEKGRAFLYESKKDRSENVMVVDLVRNDLSKICEKGSVLVKELFGIYTFPQVHQMISTVSGQLKEGLGLSDIIRSTFPMGSMTGAPKKSVMQLIERYEKTRRGVFSGSIGYITPERDFDFNVVIRSILYHRGKKYLSFQAGSAITFYSDPQEEYQECLLKVSAIKKVLAEANTL